MTMTDRDEDVVDFVTRLRKQAQRCQSEATESDNMIRDHVIAKCPYPGLQVRLLEADALNLSQVVQMWKSHLQVREQAAKLQKMGLNDPKVETEEEPKPEDVCHVSHAKSKWKPSRGQQPERKFLCFRCGEEGHAARQCQISRGKICSKCGGRNHLAKACRSKMHHLTHPQKVSVNTVDEVEDEYVFTTSHGTKEVSLVTVTIDDQAVQVMVDTGASIDVITREDFKKLKGRKTTKTRRRLMPYGTNIPLALDGEFLAATKANNKEVQSCWVIAAKGKLSLLSGTTAQLLGLVKVNTEEVRAVGTTKTVEEVLSQNSEVFFFIFLFYYFFIYKFILRSTSQKLTALVHGRVSGCPAECSGRRPA